jgi:hypothetical protein
LCLEFLLGTSSPSDVSSDPVVPGQAGHPTAYFFLIQGYYQRQMGRWWVFFTPSVVHPFFIQTYVSKIYDVHLFYIHIFPTSGQDVQKGPKNFKDVMEYLRYQQLTARSHTQPLGRRWKIRDETQAT